MCVCAENWRADSDTHVDDCERERETERINERRNGEVKREEIEKNERGGRGRIRKERGADGCHSSVITSDSLS